jgi:hypothetical protein
MRRRRVLVMILVILVVVAIAVTWLLGRLTARDRVMICEYAPRETSPH